MTCPDHRAPTAHDCPGTTAGTSTGWRLDLDGHTDTNTDSDIDPATEIADGTAQRPSVSALFRPGFGLAIVTLVVVGGALAVVALAGPLDSGIDPYGVEAQIADESNAARVAADIPPVTADPDLAEVARSHSRNMRDQGFVGHTDPEGNEPTDRLQAAGIDCHPGENIYQAPRGGLARSEHALADHVVQSWLASPGHRETLLRPRFTRQGIGVAVAEDTVYITQVFC